MSKEKFIKIKQFSKNFFKRVFRTSTLAVIFTIAAIISAFTTYKAFTNEYDFINDSSSKVLNLIVIDSILLLIIIVLLSKKIVQLLFARKHGYVGSKMQTRIVLMFSLVAIIPTILMTIFSLFFFNSGIQSWFNEKVSGAIDGSINVARVYLEEHKKIIGADILGVARDLNRDVDNLRRKPNQFDQKLAILAGVRKLPEAIVFQYKSIDTPFQIISKTKISYTLGIVLKNLDNDVIERVKKGELIILTDESDDRVIAITRLEDYVDSYLIVGRYTDNKIINYIKSTEGAANEYKKLKDDISIFQLNFFIVFIVISLLILFAVIWLGFAYAVSITNPIKNLISATENIKDGDFSVRVQEGNKNDEMSSLGKAFNDMSEKLEEQRTELISAQRRSAWSDVARRIAHEIKNPLTPIQLSTDRLRNKYSKDLENADDFKKYLNTISRNVESIGSMVDEFVGFARIPAPIFEMNNILDLVNEVVFARSETLNNINLTINTSELENKYFYCDSNQISRMVTNLIKNSEESIKEKMEVEDCDFKSIIDITIKSNDDGLNILIRDNGKGFDESGIEKITEPYVTTKNKGSGLGLAIVKKIIEDHNGIIKFSNYELGACVSIFFQIKQDQMKQDKI